MSRPFVTPWTAACQASLAVTNARSLLKLTSIEPSSHLILCRPLLLPSVFPSTTVFSNQSVFTSSGQSIGASASVLPLNLQDWFPLGWLVWSLCSPRTLKSLLQHHSSKASILWLSAFFMVQLSHPYTTTGKTIALMFVCNKRQVYSPVGYKTVQCCS